MKILLVDQDTEKQAKLAERIRAFDPQDVELLNIQVKLSSLDEYLERVDQADIVILGAGLGANAIPVARNISIASPSAPVILFVDDRDYARGAFKEAYQVGVRKVLSDSSSHLDLYQELVAIHTDFYRTGRASQGKIVVVTSAKGGAGVTTATAAIGEACSRFGKKTMIWDLDVETADLCRGLSMYGASPEIVEGWVNGSYQLNTVTFQEALVPLGENASLLVAPRSIAEATDLVCHVECVGIVKRVLELARATHDITIIDSAGLNGPIEGALYQAADSIIVLTGECALAVSATDLLIDRIRKISGATDKISILSTGAHVSLQDIEHELDPHQKLGPQAWILPELKNDPYGHDWPGTGRTLYSKGSTESQVALEAIITRLNLVPVELPALHGATSKVPATAMISRSNAIGRTEIIHSALDRAVDKLANTANRFKLSFMGNQPQGAIASSKP